MFLKLLKQNTLSLAATTKHRGCHKGKVFKAYLSRKDSDQIRQHQCSCGQQVFVNWLIFCLMSHNKTQPQNISTRTALNSSQLIDRSITHGAKLINLPPESLLIGRSDKLVRDLFETKGPVYKHR